MNEAMKKIGELGVLPLMTVNDPQDALRFGEALLKGGLPAAEVTFRTAAAEKSIAALTKTFPELFVGAGTWIAPNELIEEKKFTEIARRAKEAVEIAGTARAKA